MSPGKCDHKEEKIFRDVEAEANVVKSTKLGIDLPFKGSNAPFKWQNNKSYFPITITEWYRILYHFNEPEGIFQIFPTILIFRTDLNFKSQNDIVQFVAVT